MSMPSPVRILEAEVRPESKSALDILIRNQLDIVSQEVALGAAAWTSSSETKSVINGLGDYLSRTARVLSRLTDNLVQGSHVESTAREAHERSRIETSVSDLSAVVAMDLEFTKLRKIRDLTEKFSRDVVDIWRAGPSGEPTFQRTVLPPIRDKRNSLARILLPVSPTDVDPKPQAITEVRSPEAERAQQPPSPDEDGSAEGSDDQDDEEALFVKIVEALKGRGTGKYYCPLAKNCNKGGVDKDGKLIVFDRNSSFKQHCNKHRRPWRCNTPGCPNPPKKRRFARRDGLERHRRTVAHTVVHSLSQPSHQVHSAVEIL